MLIMNIKVLFIVLIVFLSQFVKGQNTNENQKVLRVNVINPGVEYEFPIFKNNLISTNIGWGYGIAYTNLSSGSPGWVKLLTPFMDVEYKYLYNSKKRLAKKRNTNFNSGNYFGLKMLYRGKETSSNILRSDDKDYAIGPMWGIQRGYGIMHLSFNIGMYYYFDRYYDGVTPMAQLNIGIHIFKR